MAFHLSLSLLCLCAAVWSLRLSLTEAIPCTSADVQQYLMDPAPSGSRIGCVFTGQLTCTTTGLLTNDDVTLSNTFTWDQGSSVLVGFLLIPAALVYTANIYFRNEPSQGIGLPSMEAGYSFSSLSVPEEHLETTILGNQDLSQTDSGLRNISLVVTTDLHDFTQQFTHFFINFTFPDSSPVDSLVLSEVELCTDEVAVTLDPITLEEGDITVEVGPDNVTSTIDLSCTVTNEGRFEFFWTPSPAATTYQTASLDGTRTSRLQVSRLTSGHSGEYVCEANYTAAALPVDVTATPSSKRTVTLNLLGSLTPLKSSVMGVVNTSVSLSCEMYGYVTGATDIIWRFENQGELESDSVYSITEMNGDRLLQNGGDSPIPSVKSVLTIERPTSSQAGTYLCVGAGLTGIVSLDIESNLEPPSPSPSSSPVLSPTFSPVDNGDGSSSGGSGGLPIAAVVGGVIGGLAVLILVVVVIIIVMCFLKRRKSAHVELYVSKEDLASDPFYAEVQKLEPPPLPARMYPGAYAQIDAPMREEIELAAMNHNRDSVSSAPITDNPTLAKLKQAPAFLQGTWERNPKYMSVDGLDLSDGGPASHHRLRFGSVPALDTVPSPSQSLLNIYAQPIHPARQPMRHSLSPPPATACPLYSEALTPTLFRQQHQVSQADSPPPDADVELHPYASIYADPRPLRKSEGPLEVTHQNVEEIRNLGIGQFGQVVLAKTIGLSLKDLKLSTINDDKSIGVLVAMKKLKPSAQEAVKEAFEKEIKFVSRLHHENVVSLLAICSTDNPFILMEYMENGDLNQYLRKHDIAPPSEDPPGENQLKVSSLLKMCVHIASGMQYLASLKFIHRDLATRNCLVGDNDVVKVADFGMSRSLYSSYYYRIRGRAMLPIRWMAYECFYGKFSEKTDVWAFGVTMWEIFTFVRKQPYGEMSDQEVIDDATKDENRKLLPKPEYCPEEVYEVMLRCWVHEPGERADFEEIYSTLQAIYSYSDIEIQ